MDTNLFETAPSSSLSSQSMSFYHLLNGAPHLHLMSFRNHVRSEEDTIDKYFQYLFRQNSDQKCLSFFSRFSNFLSICYPVESVDDESMFKLCGQSILDDRIYRIQEQIRNDEIIMDANRKYLDEETMRILSLSNEHVKKVNICIAYRNVAPCTTTMESIVHLSKRFQFRSILYHT